MPWWFSSCVGRCLTTVRHRPLFFCKKTTKKWDADISQPPDWVLNLLERVVREDAGGKTGGKKPDNAQK